MIKSEKRKQKKKIEKNINAAVPEMHNHCPFLIIQKEDNF